MTKISLILLAEAEWITIALLIVLAIIAFVDCFKILFQTDDEFDANYNARLTLND